MPNVRVWSSVACVALFGCLEPAAPAPEVGVTSEALDACTETVPANRNVDGVPAYAQCSASEDAAIYSNNGIDTSLTQVDKTWVKTQSSGGYQCTELAHRYLYFRWNVKWIPNGNAGNWCDTQPPASAGVVQTMAPVHGDVMVLAPGSCGASSDTGHVNLIDSVDMASAKVTAVEQNVAGRHPYNMSCAKCFLHVMANDGTPMPISGAPPATTPPAGAAGSGGSTSTPTVPPGNPGRPSPPANPGAAGAPSSFPNGTGNPGSTPVVPPAASLPPPSAAPTSSTSQSSGAAGSAGNGFKVVTVDDEPAAAGAGGSAPAPAAANGGCSVVTPHAGSSAAPWFLMLAGSLIARRRRR